MHFPKFFLSFLLVFAGCAGTGSDEAVDTAAISPEAAPATPLAQEAQEAPVQVPAEQGVVDIDIANALGANIPCRVVLMDEYGSPPRRLEVPTGKLEVPVPIGMYRCYVHAYDEGVPVLAEIQDIQVKAGEPSYLLVNLLEGSAGRIGVHGFDSDGDLAIDRVELASGTSPTDAASVPGKPTLPYNTAVLSNGAKWYRGELNAQSSYGTGTESVAELVRRAEKSGLDFLAITDRNSMASIEDPGYTSSSMVLIPAMEWGRDDMGYALIYGPRTLPEPPSTMDAAQAECLRVQAQNGAFAVARPCFPDSPWKWGLSYVNAVQVWCRDWREVPPMSLNLLPEDYKIREKGDTPGEQGALIHSIAAAAAAADLDSMSANVQSTRFWDYELVRGLMAAGIAGSASGGPAVPLGAPVTYIYAENKSLPAIMEGLVLGRTYMSSSLDGPQLSFEAQVLVPGGASVGIGGAVPLDVDVRFSVGVLNAVGKKLEVLLNGRPIISKIIESEAFVTQFNQHPVNYSVYRVRVVGEPDKQGFGPIDVLAMSSPIYAQDITQEILWRFPNLDVSKTWVKVQEDTTPTVRFPENIQPMTPGRHFIPPVNPESAPAPAAP